MRMTPVDRDGAASVGGNVVKRAVTSGFCSPRELKGWYDSLPKCCERRDLIRWHSTLITDGPSASSATASASG